MKKEKNKIKFGQVWKATKDYHITEWWSPQKNLIIPKETRVVALGPPVWGKKYFDILLLSSKDLDDKLTPNLEKMEEEKEGFGVSVEIVKFKECFTLDADQTILFDNHDAAVFWKEIREHRPL